MIESVTYVPGLYIHSVQEAVGVDALTVDPGAVFAVGGLGPAGAGGQRVNRPDKIVGQASYNTHGSFVAWREFQMIVGPLYSSRLALDLFGLLSRDSSLNSTHGICTEWGKKGAKATRQTHWLRWAEVMKPLSLQVIP